MAVTAAEIRAILTLQDQLSGQLGKVQGELQKLGASAGAAGNAARSAGPSWVSMSTAVAAGTVAANAFMAAAKGVVGILGGAVSTFGDYEAQMNILRVTTGATEEQMAAMAKQARELGADLDLPSTSSAGAAKAMVELAKGGLDVENTQKAVKGALQLAAAAGIDEAKAAQMMTGALNAFGLSGENATKIANQLAYAANASALDATDLAQGFAQAGFIFKATGRPAEELTSALIVLGNAGLSGSDGATALKNAMMQASSPTKEAMGVMKEYGISLFDARGNMKALPTIIDHLNDRLGRLTPQQRNAALAAMFQSDGMKALIPLMAAGGDKLREYEENLGKTNAASEQAEARSKGIQGAIKGLNSQWETLQETVGAKVAPALEGGIRLLGDVLGEVNKLAVAADFSAPLEAASIRISDSWGTVKQVFGEGWEPSAAIDPMVNAVGIAATAVRDASTIIADSWRTVQQVFGEGWEPSGEIDPMVNAVGQAAQAVKTLAEGIVEAAARAGDTGAWGALQNSLGNLQQTVEFAGDRLNELSATLDRVAAASGVAMRPVDALAAIIRGAAQGFEYATVMLDGWIDGALSGINIAANFAVGLSSLGTAMRALATGDIDLLRNSVVNAREAFAAGITAAEEYRARGLERVGAQAAITAQMVGEGMAQVQASTETSMGAAAAAAEASMADIESSAQTHAAGAVAAVEGQAGAASAAGSSLGSNLGAGIVDGIMGWIGRVRAAAAEMVGAAIGSGNVEGEIHSPSERTKETGRMLAAGVAEGIKELSPEVQARMRDLIDAAAEYAPVAGEIKRVEAEIAAVRQRGQTDAIFRAKEMITIDSEALRLKKEMAIAERGMLPIRQALARASREVENLSRGSLGDRQAVIGMDGQRKEIRLQIIDLERQLIGMDSDSKKAQGIQKQIDKLQDQDRLLSLEAERIGLTNEVAATGARIRREALDDQIRGQEDALAPLRDQIALLGAEQSVFQALEAIIKNALDNEIAERERLIAVFRAEAQPIIDRIKVGLAYVDQLEAEGVLTKEQADKLREVGKNLDVATAGTAALGKAAEASAPQIDAATKKADEMAAAGARIAGSYDKAANKVKELGETIGKIDTPFIDQQNPKARLQKRAMGGLVSAGVPYLVGERGPELMVPGSDGTILPSEATASLLDGTSGGSTGRGAGGGGRAVHVHLEGAQIYGFTDFENAVQRAVGRGLKRGQFGG